MSERKELVGFNPWCSDIQVERLEAVSYLVGRPRTRLAADIVIRSLLEPPSQEVIQRSETGPVSQNRVFFYLGSEDAQNLYKLAGENGIRPNTTARRLINHSLNALVEELPHIDLVADLRRGLQQRLSPKLGK
ncbi:MAG TPA: hypothetical protein VFX86_02975 [Candidatus Saccharimonadales bacterium]|nr:hypothetical protein [Candidatus Saccharimonadales bacterium]